MTAFAMRARDVSVRAVVERGVARLFVELRMFCGPSRVYTLQRATASVRTVERG